MKTSGSIQNISISNPNGPRIDSVHFGTDGWRAILDEDFNPCSVARVADACARAFSRQLDDWAANAASGRTATAVDDISGAVAAAANGASSAIAAANITLNALATSRRTGQTEQQPALVIGYDCRREAGKYAALVAAVVAAHGFQAIVSDRYCPTPALCWSIAHLPQAIGGIMLTSSHNPAEYLGIKLRMADGGASPKSFTDEVESLLSDDLPDCYPHALAAFAAAVNATPENPASALSLAPELCFANLMGDYLEALVASVDTEMIRQAELQVVLDPLFGAGRGYQAQVLANMGVQVSEVNGAADPSFQGLHPEPILPWVSTGQAEVVCLGYDACLITDGDADRIGAIDEHGNYVTSHRIMALLISHLAEDRGQRGRVVRTSAGSNLLMRQCQRLGLELATRPIGFKWIYAEMLKGDVLIGGEESGGIGFPTHVRERDGLLAGLLLVEMMAQRQKSLSALVEELLAELGCLEYARRDLRLSESQKTQFVEKHLAVASSEAPGGLSAGDISPCPAAVGGNALPSFYQPLFAALHEELIDVDQSDGIMFRFASDAWLLVRTSGTEPLVRVYSEASDKSRVDELLDIGCALAEGEI
ncbi:MAG: phosphoglucosamine mutase [Actinomycetia bacterium]|nr:phosphoglucosamine mutase [Actinomycetes bacterium]